MWFFRAVLRRVEVGKYVVKRRVVDFARAVALEEARVARGKHKGYV